MIPSTELRKSAQAQLGSYHCQFLTPSCYATSVKTADCTSLPERLQRWTDGPGLPSML